MTRTYVELAPCGVFCGACPSFKKTCYGCASEDHTQKRSSKWSCKIRDCCYNKKGLQFCVDCEDYPCKLINKKLMRAHKHDPKFEYRFEIPSIFPHLKKMGVHKYYRAQTNRWSCHDCEGTIHFYHYQCDKCGKKQRPKESVLSND